MIKIRRSEAGCACFAQTTMKKNELVSAVADKTGLTNRQSEMAVDAIMEIIMDSLQEGDPVALIGFGTFDVKDRDARMVRSIKTGEMVEVPANRVPVFRPGSVLKEKVSL